MQILPWQAPVKVLNDIKMQVFSEKTSKKSTCAVMIRIIITFTNQVFL